MMLFVPFLKLNNYIFSYEKNFPEYNNNSQKLKELEAEYKDILERLDNLEKQGVIGAFDKRTIGQS